MRRCEFIAALGGAVAWPLRLVRFVFLLMLLTDLGEVTAFGEGRWFELDYDDITITYDLTTVQMIQPGKFTIISTTIYHPDVMKFKLVVLDTLRSYCRLPDGKYDPPVKLFTLGKPDMPVEKIEIETKQTDNGGSKKFKHVIWRMPYRKLARNGQTGLEEDIGFFTCEGPAVKSADEDYEEMRSVTMNGTSMKEMYDCKHGVMGTFIHTDDPLSKVIAGTNIRGAFLKAYLGLCRAVTGEAPYISEE
jgi:hypothetical protein